MAMELILFVTHGKTAKFCNIRYGKPGIRKRNYWDRDVGGRGYGTAKRRIVLFAGFRRLIAGKREIIQVGIRTSMHMVLMICIMRLGGWTCSLGSFAAGIGRRTSGAMNRQTT